MNIVLLLFGTQLCESAKNVSQAHFLHISSAFLQLLQLQS
jgi:hypothetical protein